MAPCTLAVSGEEPHLLPFVEKTARSSQSSLRVQIQERVEIFSGSLPCRSTTFCHHHQHSPHGRAFSCLPSAIACACSVISVLLCAKAAFAELLIRFASEDQETITMSIEHFQIADASFKFIFDFINNGPCWQRPSDVMGPWPSRTADERAVYNQSAYLSAGS